MTGAFYLVQLAPDAAPQRVKFGWASDPSRRLLDHRCAAPTAQLVRSWPCLQEWEQKAIVAITTERCVRVSREVFDSEDLDDVIRRAEEYFANHLTQETCEPPRQVGEGERALATVRKRQRLSQRALAELAGVSASVIYAIENGRSTYPRLEVMRKLCDALKVEPTDIDEFRRAIEPVSLPVGEEHQ
jgi:DNA-binding XRE family transcriptional regulator